MFLRNSKHLTQDVRNASAESLEFPLKPGQKCSQWTGRCKKPFWRNIKHSVMVWSWISVSGVGDVKTDGLNKEKYSQILMRRSVPSGKPVIDNSFIFQHDDDRKHATSALKAHLNRKTANGSVKIFYCTKVTVLCFLTNSLKLCKQWSSISPVCSVSPANTALWVPVVTFRQ